jgi:ribosomal protein L33
MNLQWSSATRYRQSFMARAAMVMVAALMLAQWGALTHTYSHDQNARSHTERLSHVKSCPECPSFAPVLAVAGSQAVFSAILSTPIHLSDSSLPVALLDVPIALAFRSRAPPRSELKSSN